MMKELYTSPEIQLVSFVSKERLASDAPTIDASVFFSSGDSVAQTDVKYDVPLFFDF